MSDLNNNFLFFIMPSKFVLNAIFAMSNILISISLIHKINNNLKGYKGINSLNHTENHFNHIQFLNYVSQAALI